MEEIRKEFDLDIQMEKEIEIDKRKVKKILEKKIEEMGVNRERIGVKDVERRVKMEIGRVKKIEKVEEDKRIMSEVGIKRINLEMIYGMNLKKVEKLREK